MLAWQEPLKDSRHLEISLKFIILTCLMIFTYIIWMKYIYFKGTTGRGSQLKNLRKKEAIDIYLAGAPIDSRLSL